MQKVSSIIKKCFGYSNALLSGSMDIIVIKQPNGKLKATPLRLRFSNYRVPRAGRKKVIVKVNKKIVDVPMFLQKDGTAFILLENKKYNNNDSNDNIETESSKSLNDNIPKIKINKTLDFDEKKEEYIPSSFKKQNTISDSKNIENDSILLNNDNKINKNKIFDNEDNNKEDNNIKTIIIESDNNQNNIKLELSDCWDSISKNKYNKNFNLQGEFIKKIVNKEEFFKDPWKIIKILIWQLNMEIKY